jgi:general secretion pathway protein C
VIPQVKDGAIEGFKFVTIRQNSAFKKLGFSQGDVITAVNGNPLSSPAEAIKLFNVLKNAKRFQVQLTRGGQASSMNYQVD